VRDPRRWLKVIYLTSEHRQMWGTGRDTGLVLKLRRDRAIGKSAKRTGGRGSRLIHHAARYCYRRPFRSRPSAAWRGKGRCAHPSAEPDPLPPLLLPSPFSSLADPCRSACLTCPLPLHLHVEGVALGRGREAVPTKCHDRPGHDNNAAGQAGGTARVKILRRFRLGPHASVRGPKRDPVTALSRRLALPTPRPQPTHGAQRDA
jgi:hypothetical protein